MTYLAAAATVWGTVLNVRKRRAGFGIWCLTNAYWTLHNALLGEWAQVLIYMVNLMLSAWGFWSWGRSKD